MRFRNSVESTQTSILWVWDMFYWDKSSRNMTFTAYTCWCLDFKNHRAYINTACTLLDAVVAASELRTIWSLYESWDVLSAGVIIRHPNVAARSNSTSGSCFIWFPQPSLRGGGTKQKADEWMSGERGGRRYTRGERLCVSGEIVPTWEEEREKHIRPK